MNAENRSGAGILDLGAMGGGSGAGTASGPVKDITTAEFMSEVIEASQEKPVLVDFWAPWCGPCRQLAPALEKAVAATKGAVKLVKMNIDEHPEVAGQMGIQSIPAVVAFEGGRPKDAFMGALPESEIARFLEKLVGAQEPGPVEQALEEAERLAEAGQVSEASALFGSVLQSEPQNAAALAGMGSLYLDSGDVERARAMLSAIPEEGMGEAKALSLKAAIELAEQAQDLGDASDLQRRIEDNPADYQARFDLALLYNAAGKRQDAADQLLEIVRLDRKWNDDGARNQLLQFFEAWGAADPASQAARRRLSSLLFS
jgi:putative thioredoxin